MTVNARKYTENNSPPAKIHQLHGGTGQLIGLNGIEKI